MFDKLIESNSAEAEFKPRRKFFMVSSVVVGIMFLSAVVISLYAQDLDLGTETFELVEMIAPVTPDVPEPEPPHPQQRQNDQQETSELPVRRDLIATIDQPTRVPKEISTTRFNGPTIPIGPFIYDPNGQNSDGSGRLTGSSSADSGSSGTEPVAAEVIPPAPAVAKAELKKPVIKSKGVINGEAIVLPKPTYPAIARAINLAGVVNVQVLIDESGAVVSAKAIDGHPFFRQEAERSARQAKFKPTLLSDLPVKVTGVIVYRFMR